MHQKDVNNFTGFLATYLNGSTIKQKENFYSKKRDKKSKTNWLGVDKEKLVKLELYWKGVPIASIDKEEHPNINPEDWYFTHTGYMDINNRDIKILSRNIGFKKDGLLTIFSVSEKEGILKVSTRAA